MIQLFAVGEPAILQSVDAPMYMWNMHVTVTSVKWMEHPLDIHGFPQASTFAYEIDALEGYYIQAALRKINGPAIKIKEQQRELEPA